MVIELIDGWKHPLSSTDIAWELACEGVAMATERIPLIEGISGQDYNLRLDRRKRVLARRTGCTLDDIARARTDDQVYLALVSRYVHVYED